MAVDERTRTNLFKTGRGHRGGNAGAERRANVQQADGARLVPVCTSLAGVHKTTREKRVGRLMPERMSFESLFKVPSAVAVVAATQRSGNTACHALFSVATV